MDVYSKSYVSRTFINDRTVINDLQITMENLPLYGQGFQVIYKCYNPFLN
jgi:hypothetical protein